ncbi:hypothetical protein CLF_104137 [Clonorchis sinensis]|uniref:Uncharacterized protein n=1 Tax=Clonorchis sinensis TaxID=79923 RepID=G7YB26_CLOSI|nr:hypothetical protein CLF_104137 [Clonorchis sinensis]
MKQNADRHARPRTLRGGEEVYVKLQPSDNEWVRGCVKSTNRNLIDMLLEDGRIVRRHLDHIRTRKHGPDAEQTLEPTVQVDSGLKQESLETTTDASRFSFAAITQIAAEFHQMQANALEFLEESDHKSEDRLEEKRQHFLEGKKIRVRKVVRTTRRPFYELWDPVVQLCSIFFPQVYTCCGIAVLSCSGSTVLINLSLKGSLNSTVVRRLSLVGLGSENRTSDKTVSHTDCWSVRRAAATNNQSAHPSYLYFTTLPVAHTLGFRRVLLSNRLGSCNIIKHFRIRHFKVKSEKELRGKIWACQQTMYGSNRLNVLSCFIPNRQRPLNTQRFTALYQTQTARVSVDQGQTTPPQHAARRSLVPRPDRNIAVVFPSESFSGVRHWSGSAVRYSRHNILNAFYLKRNKIFYRNILTIFSRRLDKILTVTRYVTFTYIFR